MHHQHVDMGAVMEERDGWQMPARFGTVEEELRCLRSDAGLLDISPMTKLNIQGEHAAAFMSAACSDRQLPELGAVSQVTITAVNQSFQVSLARLADDDFLVLAAPNQAGPMSAALEAAAEGCTHIFDLTPVLAGAQLTGPAAARVLTGITEFNCSPRAFPDDSCAQTQAAEIHATLVRADLAGLPSYQLFFSRDFGEYMWETLVETAEHYNGAPVGFEAANRLRGD
jgi:heterotetrameric sarcosine oxidase gamma subunit